jgi:hypothetical protein
MKINIEHNIGDLVFFKLGGEEPAGIVTGVLVRGPEAVEYEVTWQDKIKGWHSAKELANKEEYESYKIINGID